MNRPLSGKPLESEQLPAQNSFEFWESVSRPVLQLLDEPRDWAFLDAWIAKNQFGASRFRQSIAWLENRGKVVSFLRILRDPLTRRKRTLIYWVRREWLRSHESQLRS